MIDTEGNCQECLTHSQVPRWWLTHSSLYMKNVLKKKKKNQTSVQVLMDPHPAEWLTLRLLSPLRLRSVNGTFVSPTPPSQPGDCFPEPFWPHILYILVFLIALAIVTLKEMKQDCNGFHKGNLNLCSWSKDAANKVFLQRSECLVNRFFTHNSGRLNKSEHCYVFTVSINALKEVQRMTCRVMG